MTKEPKEKEVVTIEKYDWYFGDLDRTSAETILQGYTSSFLVRSSSMPQHYAISLVDQNNVLTHALVRPVENLGKVTGYYIQDDPQKIFNTMLELIQFSPLL